MSHGETSRPHRGLHSYAISAALVLLWVGSVIFFGCMGYREVARFSDRLYFSLQLFVLHGGEFPRVMNWQLEVARFLAPLGELVGLTLGALGVTALWSDPIRLALLRFSPRKHVVICGIGRKGLQLVRDFRREHRTVVVIDKEPDNPNISACDQLGAIVISGDATTAEILRKALPHKAEALITTCGDDGANVEIAIRAGELLRDSAHAGFKCYIHVVDVELRRLLQKYKLLADRTTIAAETFNVFENSARVLFRQHFLDYDTPITREDDPRTAHLVIIGFGQLGEGVLLQAVKSCQFPNDKKLRITVIDKDAKRKHQRLLLRHRALDDLCILEFIESEAESLALFDRVRVWCAQKHSLVTLVVAFDDDSHSLSTALSLYEISHEYRSPLLVRTTSDAGLAKLVSYARQSRVPMERIHGFGTVEEACSKKVVIDETLNQFAKLIHSSFREKRQKEGRDLHDLSMRAWRDLDPELKESNWQQAEHIRFKVRAIGSEIGESARPPAPGVTISSIDANLAEKLARIEHQRWFVERSLLGWKAGNIKDLDKRVHPDLKPWNELSDNVRNYDRETVKLIPELLALNHQAIYRTASSNPNRMVREEASSADKRS